MKNLLIAGFAFCGCLYAYRCYMYEPFIGYLLVVIVFAINVILNGIIGLKELLKR